VSTKRRVIVARVAVVVAALALYEFITRLHVVDALTFVPFSAMLVAAVKLLLDPQFIVSSFLPTALEIVASVVVGGVAGIALGILLWRAPIAYEGTAPYLTLFYAVPVIAIYPVFVSIFGLSAGSTITIAGLYALIAVVTNTAIGLRSVKAVYAKVGTALELTPAQMLRHVYLPAAWPQIFTGLRLSVSFAIVGVIGTEFILSSDGLGHAVALAYNNFQPVTMYGVILLIVAIAIAINGLFGMLEAQLYRTQRAEAK
jgi:NitT/TauT family transport system permease protein